MNPPKEGIQASPHVKNTDIFMTDEIIKNPQRVSEYKTTPYIPNYTKLGKTPLPVSADEVSSLDSLNFDSEGNRLELENNEIIDNNDFINLDPINNPIQIQDNKKEEIIDINQYILIVSDRIIVKGNIDVIENAVTKILYGEHPDFSKPMDIADIIVLKRVGIKFGIFLEE